MKRLSFILTLVLVFAVTLGAQAALIDGTYEGWSDANSNGTQSAKVFIEDGKIVAVVLREFTDKHVEKDFSVYPWPEAGQAARSLGAQFVANQAAEADIVTGATHSCEGWITAVDRALVKASDNKPNQKYFDGTFMGQSEISSYGEYYKVVWVTLENDKIVNYEVQRVLPDHSIQDPSFEVYNWPLEMARESYKDAAMEATPGYVDIITGATGLVIQSNHAVRDALDKALISN